MRDYQHRAMIEGKQRRAAEIVWAVQVKGISFRCRPVGVLFAVEMKTLGGWAEFAYGPSPLGLFTKLSQSEVLTDLLAKISAS